MELSEVNSIETEPKEVHGSDWKRERDRGYPRLRFGVRHDIDVNEPQVFGEVGVLFERRYQIRKVLLTAKENSAEQVKSASRSKSTAHKAACYKHRVDVLPGPKFRAWRFAVVIVQRDAVNDALQDLDG